MKKRSKQFIGTSLPLFRKRLILLVTLLAVGFASAFAQKVTVKGKVTDETKEGLVGVSVMVKGTTNGTVTDIDGNYVLPANVGDQLVFSYVGMKTRTIAATSNPVVNVQLESDSKLLTETVVIGYGTAKKRDLTGSIVSIKADEIANKPSANPLASLQGKVAGVQVVNTGRPGQDPEIRMRGTNSINGYKPLYIVDGLFSDNINYLNPADIETMDILKDPSSLAIFGVRGANGVIIVTTKKAKEGQTLVNINSSIGFKHIYDRVDLTNAAQFKELYNEQRANQGGTPYDYTNWTADTDWQKQIFQTGFITNNNVSITGSTDKSKFYLGIGYTSEEGSIVSEKFSKVTVNLSSDYKVSDIFKFGFQVNGAKNKTPDAKEVGGVLRAAPIAPAYFNYTDPTTKMSKEYIQILPDFQSAQVWNPMIDVDTRGNHNLGVNHRVAGNIYGEVNLMKNLTFKSTWSMDYGIEESRGYSPIIQVYNPAGQTIDVLQNKEKMTQSKSTQYTAQGDNILTYNNTFDKKHNLTLMAGVTTNYVEYSSLDGMRSTNIDKIYFNVGDNQDKWWLTSLGNDAASNQTDNTKLYQWRKSTMSYLLRSLYNYDNKYLFNASFRRDGSSAFYGTGNTWDNFYSFGGAWVMTQENFMANQKTINYLKLKASWWKLGSENIGTNANTYYPTYPALTSSGGAVFGPNEDVISSYNSKYLTQGLKWEKTYSWEAGFEMMLLDNRLRFEPTYYSKRTKDIIVLLNTQGGAQNSLQNLAEVENKGVEFTASWNDKIGDTGIKYSIGGNITTLKNKVVGLGQDNANAVYDEMAKTVKGEAIGSFYGYKVIGVYQNNEDIKQSPTNNVYSVKPGDLKFADVNGDKVIDDKDRTIIGKPSPDLTYGINVGLSYKGFDLSVDMMGVYGNEIYRNWDASSFAQFNYLSKRMGRWHGEGTSNWEPILDPSRAINTSAYSSYFIEDGSFFRIRNVQLGYTVNSEMLKKLYLKSLRIYGNIQNLKTWSKASGYTPEIGGTAIKSGVDGGTYPMPAIFTFGVNLTF